MWGRSPEPAPAAHDVTRRRARASREPAVRPARAVVSTPAARAGPRTAARAEPGAGALPLAARVLWAALAVLLALRAALVFVPSMWSWSVNLGRFVHPALTWSLWAAAALALLPPVARRAAPLWTWIGGLIERAPRRAALLAAFTTAALAWATPDQVRFVGDFILRQGTVEVADRPALLFPQALPLDVLLHYGLPRALGDAALLDANGAARVLGAIEAGIFGALAVLFARALELRGAAAAATASVVLFGGYLGMFTGFSKAFAELCLLVAATGVFALRAVREGRGLTGLGVTFAIGLTLHRSAVGLLPAVALAVILGARAPAGAPAARLRRLATALVIPALALAVMGPRIVAVVRRWDVQHFAPGAREGGILAAALAGPRPVDLVNLLVMLSPLSLVVPVLLPLVLRGRAADPRDPGGERGRELLVLAALALPFVGVAPFLHPAQGLFRDWDDFAASGVAVSLLAAWVIGRALAAAPRHAWLAPAVSLAAIGPTLLWLLHHTDVDRGLQRVHAFLREPPARTAAEYGNTWDFVGIRSFRLANERERAGEHAEAERRWSEAAAAWSEAARTAPSPRILQEWALAETMVGHKRIEAGERAAAIPHYRRAAEVYRRMLEKAPENALGWLGLATVAINAGDLGEARRAAGELLRLQPGNRDALGILARLDRHEAARSTTP
jgi:tetratricopeptide repeat protein